MSKMKVKQLIAALTECEMNSEISVQNVRDWRSDEEARAAGTAYAVRTVAQVDDDEAVLYFAGPPMSPDEE